MTKTGVLLLNIGTPASPSIADVRAYLTTFLMDKRVINLPFIPRYLLVHGIIGLFRSPKSAKAYQKLWTDNGSPLLYFSQSLALKVQELLGEDYCVQVAMSYSDPTISAVLQQFKQQKVDKIIAVPMFPQYASSTSGSCVQAVIQNLAAWSEIPAFEVRKAFFAERWFTRLFADRINSFLQNGYDTLIFSYHGLPESHLNSVHAGNCESNSCTAVYSHANKQCYRAQCYETTRRIVSDLNLNNEEIVTTFQSRLSKKWIGPFTDDMVKQIANQGMKRILVVCPSFVIDCLETNIEIGVELKELFQKQGGDVLDVVSCLNDSEDWATALSNFVADPLS